MFILYTLNLCLEYPIMRFLAKETNYIITLFSKFNIQKSLFFLNVGINEIYAVFIRKKGICTLVY